MQISKFKFSMFFLGIVILQLLINIFTQVSVDGLGVMMVILLAYGVYSLRFVVVISLLADLIGHWYLGSHLLAIILIGFVMARLVNYFRMSYFMQKTLIIISFYSFLMAIIALVNGMLHNYTFSWLEYVIEIILCPISLMLFNKYIIKPSASVIFE